MLLEAARSAVKHGGLSILISSSILFCAGMAVWLIASNGVISELGVLVGRGTFLAALMMFVFLLFLFRLFDGAIRQTTMGIAFCQDGSSLISRPTTGIDDFVQGGSSHD